MARHTEEVIKSVVLAGVDDNYIRGVVLSTEDILSRSLFAITAIIESKEVHRHATATLCTVSAVSSFQHHTKQCFNLGDMSLASVKKSYSIDSKKQQLGMLNILELFVLLAETVKEG